MAEIDQPAASAFGIPLAGLAQALRWAVLPAFAVGAVPALDLATGSRHGATLMAAFADPLSVLAARSPGARPTGALTQSKPRRDHDREERVLSEALTRPLLPTDAPGGGVVPAAPGGVAPDVPVAEVLPDSVVPTGIDTADIGPGPVPTAYFPGSGITVVPGGGFPVVGGGGGGGGGTPDTPTVTTPVTPVTPVASVPEPATWGMLLLGFGIVGRALRLRRGPAERRA